MLAVALCALVAYHALATHFEGQAWQAAVMRAVGMRTQRTWWELMKESLLVGVVGTALGLPLGMLLGHVLLPAVSAAAAVTHHVTVSPTALVVTPWTLGLATVIGLVTAALAAVVPSWHAARSAIADMLRRRGMETPDRRAAGRWVRRARIAVLGGLVATTAVGVVVHSAAIGFLETALVALLTALAARPLLERLAPGLSALVGRIAGRAGIFPGANLLDHTRRTALAVAVLGVGIGCVVWLRIVATSFERTLIETLGDTMRAELIVASPRHVGGWVPAPIEDGILARLRSLPEVRGVAANRLAETSFRGAAIALNAFDPAYFDEAGFGRPRLHGTHAPEVWKHVADGAGVIASTNLLLHFDLRVGDVIRLDTPSGPLELPILGAALAFVSPTGTLELSRTLYAERWRDTQVNRVWVRTDPAVEAGTARAAIARAVGGAYGVQVFTAGEMLAQLAEQARRAFAPVGVVEGIVLVVVLIGIGDALASAVLKRTRAIGTLRAVGLRRADVVRMVVAEGLVIAGLGLLLGLAAGFGLAAVWVYATLPSLLGWMVELHVPWGRLALVAAATVVVAVLAALLPARAAARLEATAALRYE